MTNHLIIDFETMGKDATKCAVIDCSVMVFNFEKFTRNPYSLNSITETRKFKLSVVDQVKNYNWEIYKSTLQFWE